jgi:hypothetical protein
LTNLGGPENSHGQEIDGEVCHPRFLRRLACEDISVKAGVPA